VKRLISFRIVKEKLLYLIGIPRRFASEDVLRSSAFFGQFGSLDRLVINHNPKDVYEGQVAVYVHFKSSISVAIALKILNGLQMSDGNTLRCSFGTSKYCANFLAYAKCEA